MLTRLTNFVIKGYQGYAIDKSMIKKVFSKRQSESEKRAMAEKNDGKIE